MTNMKRRGFLGFLAAAGIATITGASSDVSLVPAPAPSPGNSEKHTWTFHRKPGLFDIVAYTGIGSSITLPNSLGEAIGCVLIKCTTKPSDWFILETDGAEVTLPNDFNEAGHSYVAYQWGKEMMPQLQPYLDKLREIQREKNNA
jgi:hypothetical protein